ncbi:hypothetical protein GUJ93_ZPchr0013g37244 [Zizania palustris]|uniref:Uncharacterized protein n=1 Tax=Zizania palustris TaxID=103762 RepID=A0A8J5X086_ZIZPA|nr:hypothetical protein GUJ93_ZPchr0013g37244 [Zizania palustris]
MPGEDSMQPGWEKDGAVAMIAADEPGTPGVVVEEEDEERATRTALAAARAAASTMVRAAAASALDALGSGVKVAWTTAATMLAAVFGIEPAMARVEEERRGLEPSLIPCERKNHLYYSVIG